MLSEWVPGYPLLSRALTHPKEEGVQQSSPLPSEPSLAQGSLLPSPQEEVVPESIPLQICY